MSQTSNPSQEYLKNAVLTASPEQLQLMLYDGAIRYATRGLEAMHARDREAQFNALDRAQQIVLEMSNGLRSEVNPELAEQMGALYAFVYRRLVDGNINQDEQAIQDALRILRHQRETWVLLMDKIRKELSSATAGRPAPAQPSSDNAASPSPSPQNATSNAGSRFRPAADGETSSFTAEG